MKKQKSFRPPQVIRDAVTRGRESSSTEVEVDFSKSDYVPVTDVQKAYAYLSKNRAAFRPDLQKDEPTAEWLLWGGMPALRWSRRILRQEGMLKASRSGDFELPQSIDLQLGPEIFAGVVKGECDEVATKMEQAGLSSSCVPVEGGTLVLFPAEVAVFEEGNVLKIYEEEVDEVYELSPTANPKQVFEADYDATIMIEESKSKVRSILKASDGNTAYSSHSVDGSVSVGDLSIDELYLLITEDTSELEAQVIKVDDELGLVFGWSVICCIDDEPYYDLQKDHIPEEDLIEPFMEFMLNSRVQGDMHARTEDKEVVDKGRVVFCFPMTREVAKAFGIQTRVTGLMIAIKPDTPEILQKFKDGEYTGFSIGGSRDIRYDEEAD
jgi:hypothetical protein